MKKWWSFIGALIGWFAVVTQFVLMMQNRVVSIAETTIRFFSFFTILTNTLVAVYFTTLFVNQKGRLQKFFESEGNLTAITIYITVVGLVYQLVLRHLWQPTGIQQLVDELLHSVTPLYAIVFWWLYEQKRTVQLKQSFSWLIYPLTYLGYILFRGYYSGFYPYPFVDVSTLGINKVLMNSGVLLLVFLGLSFLFWGVGRLTTKG